jgi:hypothetical protein
VSGLQPLPGFDWSKVKWGGPRARVTEECSYCGAPLGEAPLRFFSPRGAACAFCEECMQKWWGFAPYEEPDEDAEGRGL